MGAYKITPSSVDALNEFECVIMMPKKLNS